MHENKLLCKCKFLTYDFVRYFHLNDPSRRFIACIPKSKDPKYITVSPTAGVEEI